MLEFTRTSARLSEQVKSGAAMGHMHCFHLACLSAWPPQKDKRHKFQSSHCDSVMLLSFQCARMHMWTLTVNSCCYIGSCLFFFCYYCTSTSHAADYGIRGAFTFTLVTLFNASCCPLMCWQEVKYVHSSTKNFIEFFTALL